MRIKDIEFSEKDYIMQIGTELDLGGVAKKAYGTEYPNLSVTFKDGIAESEDGRIVLYYDTLAQVADKMERGILSIDDFNLYDDFENVPFVNFWMVQYGTLQSIFLDKQKVSFYGEEINFGTEFVSSNTKQ